MFTKRLKSALCTLLSVSIAATSVAPGVASAQTSGPDLRATIRLGSQAVSFPRLTWRPLGTVELGDERSRGADAPAQSSLAAALNTAGEALGLGQRDLAAVLNAVPENQPFVLGRTDSFTQIGRVDVFKVQRTGTQSQLLHARFTPEHGMAWAASRTYLTSSERASPDALGRNPFSAFDNGSGNFTGANLAGMLVAVGHAMKLAGTANGLLVETKVQEPVTWTTKSGSIRKKVTTHVKYYGKPAYYFAAPVSDAAQAQLVPGVCLSDLSGTANQPCPSGLLAAAGSSFDLVAGGNLDGSSELLAYVTQTKKGWGWIAMFIVGSVIGPLVGLPANPFNFKDIGERVLGNKSTVVTGFQIDMKESGLGQAGESTTADMSTRELLQSRQTPAMQLPGYAAPSAEANVFTQGLGNALRQRNTQDTSQMLAPARRAVFGDCPLGAAARDCSGLETGIVDRMDQRKSMKHLQVADDTLSPEAVRPDTYFGERTDRVSVTKVPIVDSRALPGSYQDVPVTPQLEVFKCTGWWEPGCSHLYYSFGGD